MSEPESEALARHLRAHPVRASRALARVEVARAVRPHGTQATRRAGRLLERISLLHLDEVLLDSAAALDGRTLRCLEAIHLAAAQTLGGELAAIISYDQRMLASARSMGLDVSAPA